MTQEREGMASSAFAGVENDDRVQEKSGIASDIA